MNPLLIIAFIGRTRHNQKHTWEPTYVSRGRVLTEPSYAPRSSTAVTDTELSSMPHGKTVRLSLAEHASDRDPTDSNPNTAYTDSMTFEDHKERKEKRRMGLGNDSPSYSSV